MRDCSEFENSISIINKFITEIDKIIHSRAFNTTENEEDEDIDININHHEPIKLDELSLASISLISGFLPFEDLLKFEKINKRIFIGSRSPLSLQKLDEYTFLDCIKYSNHYKCMYNWFRLRNIKSVTIDVDYVYYELYDDDEEPKRNENNVKFRHLPIWNSIEKLSLTADWHPKEIDDLFKAKDIFKNLQFLSWKQEEYNGEPIDKDKSFILPQLKGCDFYVDYDGPSVNQLDTEKFESYHGIHYDLDALHRNNKAQQLRELCLRGDDMDINDEIGDNVHSDFRDLRRLNIDFNDMKAYKPIMMDLLNGNIDTLEYVGVKCDCDKAYDKGLQIVMEIFSDCLKNKHKSKLKIRITASTKIQKINNIDFINLIETLSKMTDNFMLILIIPGIYEELDEKIKSDDKYLINTDKNNKGYCYISNKGCTLCGYSENWIMTCKNCE